VVVDKNKEAPPPPPAKRGGELPNGMLVL